jgi:ribonuclease VapC
MVIDSSAVLAIFFDEPEASVYASAMLNDPVCLMSAVSLVEISMVAIGRRNRDHLGALDLLIEDMGLSWCLLTGHKLRWRVKLFVDLVKGLIRRG